MITSKEPLISIVVLNYDGLLYLKKSIPPLLELEYPNYEIIVVDNGSEDGSLNFLLQFKKIRIIKNKKNLGYSKGKNLGIKSAKGEFILLLDEDILIKNKNILNNLLIEYNKLDKIGFLSILLKQGEELHTTLYGGFISYLNFYKNKKIKISKIVGHEIFESAGPDGGAVFLQKDFFLSIGMFDESQPYYIDVGDIGLRAIIMGYKNYVYCKDYFVHLGKTRKENNRVWCLKYKYCFSGFARLIVKNYKVSNLFLVSPLLFFYFSLKTIKQLIYRKNICVIMAFFSSMILFIKNLSNTLYKRRGLQQKRIIKKDIFLKIQAPNF